MSANEGTFCKVFLNSIAVQRVNGGGGGRRGHPNTKVYSEKRMPWGQWSKKGGWEQTVLASSLAAAHTPRSEGGGNRTLHTDVFERCAKQDHKRGARKKVADNVPQPSKKRRGTMSGEVHIPHIWARTAGGRVLSTECTGRLRCLTPI